MCVQTCRMSTEVQIQIQTPNNNHHIIGMKLALCICTTIKYQYYNMLFHVVFFTLRYRRRAGLCGDQL